MSKYQGADAAKLYHTKDGRWAPGSRCAWREMEDAPEADFLNAVAGTVTLGWLRSEWPELRGLPWDQVIEQLNARSARVIDGRLVRSCGGGAC